MSALWCPCGLCPAISGTAAPSPQVSWTGSARASSRMLAALPWLHRWSRLPVVASNLLLNGPKAVASVRWKRHWHSWCGGIRQRGGDVAVLMCQSMAASSGCESSAVVSFALRPLSRAYRLPRWCSCSLASAAHESQEVADIRNFDTAIHRTDVQASNTLTRCPCLCWSHARALVG